MVSNAPTTERPNSRPVVALMVALALLIAGRLIHNHWSLQATQSVHASPQQKLDLNSASAVELAQVPGLGPSRSEAIVSHRTLYGSFSDPQDLTSVPGIGPARAAKIRDTLQVDSLSSTSPPSSVGKAQKIQLGEPPINLNIASEQELQRLPGIGPALASRIVQARSIQLFETVDDLRRVRGIGAKTLENLRPWVCVR